MSKPWIEFKFQIEFAGRVESESMTVPSTTLWADVKLRSTFPVVGEEHTRTWPSYAWPGAYPVYYQTKDCGTLCPSCANQELTRTLDADDAQFYIVDQDINYEDTDMCCDHCNKGIPAAYADDSDGR